MRLLPLFVLGITAQTAETTTELIYDVYDDSYVFETTVEPTTLPAPTTTATTTAAPEDYVLYDVPEATTSAPEVVEEADLIDARSNARNTVVTVNSLVNLQLELLADGDFQFSWNYDSTHTTYKFEFQEIEGNNQNVTDWVVFAGSVGSSVDVSTTIITLTPTGPNKVFRWRITPLVATTEGSYSEIVGQSRTNAVVHQPGTPYTGNGGFAAQVLLPTDFSNTNFMTTSASDTNGYVIAILVQFPAGCPSITVTSDLSEYYVYKDPALTDNHRIYVFHQTHFSSQFSGPVKAFHYYVSGAAYGGCDLSDPENSVTVSVANSQYLVRTTEATDVVVTDVFPSDYNYPPSTWTHQVQVNMTTLIQPDVQQGVSRAISVPRVDVSNNCTVQVSVQGEVYASPTEPTHSPGWGYLNTYNSNLYMTDLWATANNGTTVGNSGTNFIFVTLDWNRYMGLHLRNNADNCPVLITTAAATFVELNPAKNLALAVAPVLG